MINATLAQFTWHGPAIASRLDRCYVTASIKPESCNAKHLSVSDHSLVDVTVAINHSKIFGPGYWKNNVTLYDHVSCFEFIEKHWNRWVILQLIYPNKYLWCLEKKEMLRELLINLSKCKSSIEKDEISELEQKLQQLAAALSLGKKVFTEFKHVKAEIRKRQLQNLQAVRLRSRADRLDCGNQINAAFFERLRENHKKNVHRIAK